jgi:DedD protein
MSKMAAKEDYSGDYADSMDTGQKAGPVDSELQFKKRARRRLVGAIALALFAIIVLPLVMDREPAPIAPEIQVRIPSQDAGTGMGKITTNSSSKTVATAPQPSVPEVPVAEMAKPVVSSATAASQPGDSNGNRSAEGTNANSSGVAIAAKNADKPVEIKAPVAQSSEAKIADKNRSADAVPAKESAASEGKWVVQLGAYQNTGNVNLLLGKLKELRVPAYTEKIDSPQGPRTRVRAGPFANKEAALAAQKRIRIIGVEGPVGPMSAK